VERWNRRRADHLAAVERSGANATAHGPVPHTVALNHFADWTREEYLSLVRPDRSAKRLLAAAQPGVQLHEMSTPSHMVPAEVIWRGTPADSPVKDQAACGSCWSFSSVGAIEAAWFRATGKQLLFSEQHMIDCGWEAGNSGCYGGDQIKILNWVFRRGALAAQADYPYQGINNFCRTDVEQKRFKGHWVLVEGGEEALKEAVLTKGPMVVSIDASDDSFRFYSGGVYHNPDCATKPADLDHAVIISGYATTEDGQDYWLVKNIWSPYWVRHAAAGAAAVANCCALPPWLPGCQARSPPHVLPFARPIARPTGRGRLPARDPQGQRLRRVQRAGVCGAAAAGPGLSATR
jgi:cathepsin L